MRTKRLLQITLLGATLALVGCAERRAVVTWDEAHPSRLDDNSLVRRRVAVTEHNGAPDQLLDHGGNEVELPALVLGEDGFGGGQPHASRTPAGLQIDRALTEFRNRRVAAANASTSSGVFLDAWLTVLSEVRDACAVEPTADDLSAFIRARVTLEVELEKDRSDKRLLPSDIDTRVHHALNVVDARVAELRLASGGSLMPSPRLRPGELVLRAPVSNMRITSPFGVRSDPIHGEARFHAGVDIGAPQGAMVYASSQGLVIFAGKQGGYGKHVVVDHGDGVRTHYSHLHDIFVKPGQTIDETEPLGSVGATGRATGPHLHFAVTDRRGRFLDPLVLLDMPLDVDDQGAVAPQKQVAGASQAGYSPSRSSR